MTASPQTHIGRLAAAALLALAATLAAPAALTATIDLDEVKAAGVLRHLGIPYANFVTGAGDGIGRAAALACAAHGASVILLGRTAAKLEKVYDEIESRGHPQAATYNAQRHRPTRI